MNRWRLLALPLLTFFVGACGGSDAEDDRITVFAAASLGDAFTEIAQQFEAANPGVEVELNVAASSELVAQVLEGAPADVVATADATTMGRLVDNGGAAGDPIVFATNRAAIIVASGNPFGITGLADLADPDLVVVLCAPEVPCGRYAEQVLDNAGVAVTPKSLEENVRGVVSKVTLGEADAGVVYATDVQAAGDAAAGVPIPDDVNVVAEYPIAVTADRDDGATSEAFVAFVTSPEGRSVLQSYGFGVP